MSATTKLPDAGTGSVWGAEQLLDPHKVPDKAKRVRQMFDDIAATYERVNTLTSLGRDAAWRRAAVRLASIQATDRVLDVACGTGDLSRAFAAAGPARVVGSDFAEDMLKLAARRAAPKLTWALGDALRLPFADNSFDVVSCAFGVRNFQNLEAGLTEMARVLTPKGRAIILEFQMPRGRMLGAAYRLYLQRVLPVVAKLLSGDKGGAYRYLASSVMSFVDQAGVETALKRSGFGRVTVHKFTLGVVCVFVATKASAA